MKTSSVENQIITIVGYSTKTITLKDGTILKLRNCDPKKASLTLEVIEHA